MATVMIYLLCHLIRLREAGEIKNVCCRNNRTFGMWGIRGITFPMYPFTADSLTTVKYIWFEATIRDSSVLSSRIVIYGSRLE